MKIEDFMLHMRYTFNCTV